MPTWLMNFLTKYRGWVIFLVAVPVSFMFNRVQSVRNFIFRLFFATNKYHQKMVADIQARVKEASQQGQRMCTARKPWKTMSLRVATFKSNCAQIPINLKNILELDTTKELIRVEPMVTMGDLTHFLIPKGYALAVQVEMDDLTVGGLCMGVGIETSSHRHGFLFETVEAFEVVLADGSLVRATRTNHPDLFHALPWSHGTLGFLTAVELKVVRIKPFIKLNYIPCHSQADFCAQFQAISESDQPPTYLEGLVFSPEKSVIMCGELADLSERTPENKINRINRWYKKWFYSHVETFLETGPATEFIPIRHYFHRHTPSVFFQMKDLISFANQPWYRTFFAWLGAPKISLMKLTYTKELRRQAMFNRVTQDIIVPMSDMNDSLNFCHPRFEIYPIWVCPVKLFHHGEFEGFLRNPKQGTSQMFVDIGVYGIPKAVEEKKPWDMVDVSRKLEAFSMERSGYHLLYADIFMNRAEFKAMFNHTLYETVREKYKATQAFPSIYDKVIPESWLFDAEKHVVSD